MHVIKITYWIVKCPWYFHVKPTSPADGCDLKKLYFGADPREPLLRVGLEDTFTYKAQAVADGHFWSRTGKGSFERDCSSSSAARNMLR